MKKMGRPEKWTEETIKTEADELLLWFEEKENFWLKDFAILRKYPSEYFKYFSDKSEYFLNALKRAKEIQESKLLKIGLSKRSNASMAIFALKNVAGWRDSFTDTNNLANKEKSIDLSNISSDDLQAIKAILQKYETDN